MPSIHSAALRPRGVGDGLAFRVQLLRRSKGSVLTIVFSGPFWGGGGSLVCLSLLRYLAPEPSHTNSYLQKDLTDDMG